MRRIVFIRPIASTAPRRLTMTRRISTRDPYRSVNPNYKAIKQQYKAEYGYLAKQTAQNRRYRIAKRNLYLALRRSYKNNQNNYDENLLTDAAFAAMRYGRFMPLAARFTGRSFRVLNKTVATVTTASVAVTRAAIMHPDIIANIPGAVIGMPARLTGLPKKIKTRYRQRQATKPARKREKKIFKIQKKQYDKAIGKRGLIRGALSNYLNKSTVARGIISQVDNANEDENLVVDSGVKFARGYMNIRDGVVVGASAYRHTGQALKEGIKPQKERNAQGVTSDNTNTTGERSGARLNGGRNTSSTIGGTTNRPHSRLNASGSMSGPSQLSKKQQVQRAQMNRARNRLASQRAKQKGVASRVAGAGRTVKSKVRRIAGGFFKAVKTVKAASAMTMASFVVIFILIAFSPMLWIMGLFQGSVWVGTMYLADDHDVNDAWIFASSQIVALQQQLLEFPLGDSHEVATFRSRWGDDGSIVSEEQSRIILYNVVAAGEGWDTHLVNEWAWGNMTAEEIQGSLMSSLISSVAINPHSLLAILTVLWEDFTMEEIEPILITLFVHTFDVVPDVRLVPRAHDVTITVYEYVDFGGYVDVGYFDDDGIWIPILVWVSDYQRVYRTEDITLPYTWQILHIHLMGLSMHEIIAAQPDWIWGEDEQDHYEILMESLGNRAWVGTPFDFYWLPFISSHYGYRLGPFGGGAQFHMGVDIAQPAGTPILATHSGQIVRSEYAGELGNVIEISEMRRIAREDHHVATRYAHLLERFVNVGDWVYEGDVIGTVGSTGQSTGNHLHFEVWVDGRHLNPAFFSDLNRPDPDAED